MADKPSPITTNNFNFNSRPPPPPSSTAGSNSNVPFTPRSTTFPDGQDSDDEFDIFTPTHSSPGGPRYEDLPPSYDEAQQEALRDARAGVPPIDLQIQRLGLSDGHPPLPGQAQQQPVSGLFPNEEPLKHVGDSEQIPGGQIPTGAPDPTSVLLGHALEFTHHEPDADSRYAPRLTRRVAIPQQAVPLPAPSRDCGSGRRHGSGKGRREHGGGAPWGRAAREARRMSAQNPGAGSTETLDTETNDTEESVQFFRSYSKALHAHSISPQEFADFLDGLNALCLASNSTASDLLDDDQHPDRPSSIVRNYIDSTNENFFAPRGLKVSLQSLDTLEQGLNIPEERGQRAGAVASALDQKSTPEQRALALHPWIERLETNVPAPSTRTLLLREMSERFRKPATTSPQPDGVQSDGAAPSYGTEKPRADSDATDPPHSIPEPQPGQPGRGFPPFTPFGAHHGRGPAPWMPWPHPQASWGSGGPWGRGGHHARGWGGAHHGGARGWGGAHHGAGRGWGGPGWGGWGGPGMGGPASRGCGFAPSPPTGQNDWAAFGASMGKWGEEFGKVMEEWGMQFGKQAEGWGNDIGKRAETWAAGVSARASGVSAPERGGPSGCTGAAPPPASGSGPEPSSAGPAGPAGQETGVLRGNNTTEIPRQTAKPDDDDDDDGSDTSSISTSSSSDSDSSTESQIPDTDALFLARLREINAAAETSRQKGKKPLSEIENERAQAIEKAQAKHTALNLKMEENRQKRAMKAELKRKKKEIKKEQKRMKDELKRELKGKGDAWKRRFKEEVREKKREHRKAKREARREWREKRWERRRARREGCAGASKEECVVWVVVDNLGS